MSKRKRNDFEGGVSDDLKTTSRGTRLQRQRLDAALANGKSQLFKALKIARGSERQKLGRRQKQARQKYDAIDLPRLEKEIAKLKDLDLLATAELYLFRTLSRIKSIATAPTFFPNSPKPEISSQLNDPIQVTVTSRLFRSTPVREAIDAVIRAVRETLAISEQGKGSQKLYDDNAAPRSIQETGSTTSDVGSLASRKHKNGVRRLSSERLLDDQFEETNSESKIHRVFDHEDANSAGNVWEAVDENDHSHRNEQMVTRAMTSSGQHPLSEQKKRNNVDEHEEDMWSGGASDESGDADSALSSDQSESIRKTAKNSNHKAKSTKTVFLPSLAMGGYWSGSGSSTDDDDVEAAATVKTRKNRRGQQARRAVWEKKYGTKAKHVGEQVQGRDHGWDARRGAQPMDAKARKGTRDARHSGQYNKKKVLPYSGANSDPIGTKDRREQPKTLTLHPSWEAAKKLKEMKKNVAYEGTKVRFN